MMKKNKPLIEPNEIPLEAKVSMRTRTITAIVLAILVVPSLFLGGWFFFALSVLLSICCSYELVKILNLKTRIKYFVYIATIIISLSFVYWIFIKNNIVSSSLENSISWDTFLTAEFKTLDASIILILITAGVFFFFSFASEEFDVGKTTYLISMIIVVSLCIQSMLYLRYSPFEEFKKIDVDTSTPVFKFFQSSLLFIYVILGTISNDIGAYFIGLLFGKKKVNPRISPKKTWEGFFGGMAVSFIFSVAFALILALTNYPLLPSLDLSHWYYILLLSAVMPIMANCGDFAFSAIKRNYNVKDFSKILPGHGGILDRVDSLIFTSGFIAVMLIFINNGWDFLK